MAVDSAKEDEKSVSPCEESSNSGDGNTPSSVNNTESNMVRASDFSSDDDSDDDYTSGEESSILSASAMTTDVSGVSSAVMSTSDAPTYDESGDRTKTKSASPGRKSILTPARGGKKQSTNFRFKRGALISGTAQEDTFEREDSSDGEDDDDIESGAPYSHSGSSHGTHSLWQEKSVDSAIPKLDAESVIDDDRARASNEQEKSCKTSLINRLRWRPIAVAAAAITIAIVLVYLVMSGVIRGGRGSDAKDAPGNPTAAPVSMEEMHKKIQLAVSEIVVEETLSNRSSVESQALQWLLEDDTVWTPQHEDFLSERIVQRFILVAFYFSMGGPSWYANNWLQGDECGEDPWKYINCDENGDVRAIAFSKLIHSIPAILCDCMDMMPNHYAVPLDNVGLVGQIPPFIYHLRKIENFIMKKESKLTGSIPRELGHLDQLKQLGLYYTGLSGTIPKELCKASTLSFLNLQNNDMEGGIPTEIANLTELETLVLMNNRMGGEIPWQSLAASGVRFLGLSNNDFHGIIPGGIADFATLEHLYLDGNGFNGELPSAIGQVKRLRSLNLDGNQIRGRLPVEIGLLSNLQYFSIQYNELTGPLPVTIRDMEALARLALGSNKLSGGLPSLSTLANLENLYLFENQFSGGIPSDIFDMEALSTFLVSGPVVTSGFVANMSILTKQRFSF